MTSELSPLRFRLAIFVAAYVLLWSAMLLAQGSVINTGPNIDPNKGPSEFNHHVAGYALIGVGLLVIAGRSRESWRWARLGWPFLFIAAGLFLAAWSDGEMWPRGYLSWTWLIQH